MPKIDKLKIEADVLKGYLFFLLGAIFTTIASSVGFAIQLYEKNEGWWNLLLLACILILMKFFATIFLMIRNNLNEILDAIEKE